MPPVSTDSLVETAICAASWAAFPIYGGDIDMLDRLSPVIAWRKFPLPRPTLCPEERERRRLSHLNLRNLYKKSSALDGKILVSMHAPTSDIQIWSQKDWWSNRYDAFTYWRKPNFHASITTQIADLYRSAPQPALMNAAYAMMENAEYNNYCEPSKNAYLNFSGMELTESAYSVGSGRLHRSFDIWWADQSEYCYEVNSGAMLRKCFFIRNIDTSDDAVYCAYGSGLKHCIGCFGLMNKSHHVFNEPVSPQAYEIMRNSLSGYRAWCALSEKFSAFELSRPHRCVASMNHEHCSGDQIFDSSEVFEGFYVVSAKRLRHAHECGRIADSMDISMSYDSDGLLYQCLMCGNSTRCIGGISLGKCSDVHYSINCTGCRHCFGCVGMVNVEYCIFNRQYTPETYADTVATLIEKMRTDGEWGEFFPSSLSPFGYDETQAMEEFPLSKDEATARGFRWSGYESPPPEAKKIIPASALPDTSAEVPDEILDWAIECEITKKPFRLIPQELDFYRSEHLPIPRRHPEQRHIDRARARNPRRLYTRYCAKCGAEMRTNYAPDRPEIVWCETCYDREFLG